MTATANRKAALPDFEGTEVTRAAVKITNAGDGLSDALAVQPKALHLDDEIFYVLRGTCTKVGHEPDKHDLLVRVHTIKAGAITEVDREVAEKMLQAAAEELQRRKDEVEGQLRMDEEAAAQEREAEDETAPADEIAAKAAERARRP